jgi:hypothetical protein
MSKKQIVTTTPETPPEEIVDIRSFDDLDDITYSVVVTRTDLPSLRFECRDLGYYEWETTGKEIGYPQAPPWGGTDSNGNIRFNLSDPTYIQGCREVDVQRDLRRLLKFLKMPIPGATAEEQIAALERRFGKSVIGALVIKMREIAFGGRARIESRAETFHHNGTGGAAGGEIALQRPELVESANGR